MKKTDSLFAGCVLYPIIPIILFLLGWWGMYLSGYNSLITASALSGLVIGLILDFIYIRPNLSWFYCLRPIWLILIFVFYSFAAFGFFMGVPIFHPFFGIIIGFYISRRGCLHNWDRLRFNNTLKTSNLIGLVVLSFVCFASAFFALRDPYTAANLEGMLALPFALTHRLILAIIVFGGLSLLILQSLLTHKSAIHFNKYVK